MTKNLPTEPGYYWYRDIDEGSGEAFEWKVVRLHRPYAETAHLFLDNTAETVASVGGEWGSRIPDPDETRERDEAIAHSIRTATSDIRDRLAEKFVVGILANSAQIRDEHQMITPSTDVELAYRYADAMLAERKKR